MTDVATTRTAGALAELIDGRESVAALRLLIALPAFAFAFARFRVVLWCG